MVAVMTVNCESDLHDLIDEFSKKVFSSSNTLKFEFFCLVWHARAFSFVQMIKIHSSNLNYYKQKLFRAVLKKLFNKSELLLRNHLWFTQIVSSSTVKPYHIKKKKSIFKNLCHMMVLFNSLLGPFFS